MYRQYEAASVCLSVTLCWVSRGGETTLVQRSLIPPHQQISAGDVGCDQASRQLPPPPTPSSLVLSLSLIIRKSTVKCICVFVCVCASLSLSQCVLNVNVYTCLLYRPVAGKESLFTRCFRGSSLNLSSLIRSLTTAGCSTSALIIKIWLWRHTKYDLLPLFFKPF